MSFALGTGSRPRAEMNVTPLIDVLLVLIIIFMIITPMSQGHFADVPQQQQQGKAIDPETPVVLQLLQTKSSEEPVISINQQPLAWRDLRTRLQEIYKSRAEHVLFIKGDADVEFEYVARVIDSAHSSDVQRVGLMR